jgi:hypothetical protein
MEVSYHIRHFFQNGLRDFMSNGRLGMGTSEHCIQFGVNPIQLEMEIKIFIESSKNKMYRPVEDNENKIVGYEIIGEADFTEMDN